VAARPFVGLAAVAQLGAVVAATLDVAAPTALAHLAAAAAGAVALGAGLALWPRSAAGPLAAASLALTGIAASLPPVGAAPLPPWPSDLATAGLSAALAVVVVRWLLRSIVGEALRLAATAAGLALSAPVSPRALLVLAGALGGAAAGAAGATLALVEPPGVGALGPDAPALSVAVALAAALGGRRGLGGTLLMGYLLAGVPATVAWLWPNAPSLALPFLAAGGVLLLAGRRPALGAGEHG
jgi:hypothetical protein